MFRIIFLLTVPFLDHFYDETNVKEKSYSIVFLNEDGDPISGCKFHLYEMNGNEMGKELFKDHELPKSSSMELDALPESYVFGVESEDRTYSSSWFSIKQTLKKGRNEIQLVRGGVLEIRIREISNRLKGQHVAIFCHPKDEKKSAPEDSRTITIKLDSLGPFFMAGVPEGTYAIDVMTDFNQGTVTRLFDEVEVKQGETNVLKIQKLR